MIELACIGETCIDRYLEPQPFRTVGGCGINVSIHCRKAGREVCWLGIVADDDDGQFVRDYAKRQGLDDACLENHPGQTSWTEIVVVDGERAFPLKDFSLHRNWSLSQRHAEMLLSARYVYFNTNVIEAIQPRVPEVAGQGATLFCDYSYHEERVDFIQATAPFVQCGFFSLPDDSTAGLIDKVAAYHDLGISQVIITRGPAGYLASDGDRIYTGESVAESVVDTLGAGDAFIGNFIAAYIGDHDLQHALIRGNQAAARACAHFGAIAGDAAT